MRNGKNKDINEGCMFVAKNVSPMMLRTVPGEPWISNPKHKQVIINGISEKTHREFRVFCDEKIAPLIFALNKAGVTTLYS